jgi:hypothetical protein
MWSEAKSEEVCKAQFFWLLSNFMTISADELAGISPVFADKKCFRRTAALLRRAGPISSEYLLVF